MEFSEVLIDWYQKNHRELPWRNSEDPYPIWLSEIILQQTRVAQGLPYFERFTEKYPTVQDLANAPIDDVLKLWQGLGYYSRARNLHTAAKQVVADFNGEFPANYKDLLSLKGIGPYTAAAIASFAFQLPHAVVDGNVYRVLARYYGVELPINRPSGQKYFQKLADEVLNQKRPDLHNQAIMEFGALQCKPQNPDCLSCPLSSGCEALKTKRINELPKKEGKTKVKSEWYHYLVIETPDGILMNQRKGDGIWEGLFDFPRIVSPNKTSFSDVQHEELWLKMIDNQPFELAPSSKEIKHRLSHRLLHIKFHRVKLTFTPRFQGIVVVDPEELPTFAVPIVIHDWMSSEGLI